MKYQMIRNENDYARILAKKAGIQVQINNRNELLDFTEKMVSVLSPDKYSLNTLRDSYSIQTEFGFRPRVDFEVDWKKAPVFMKFYSTFLNQFCEVDEWFMEDDQERRYTSNLPALSKESQSSDKHPDLPDFPDDGGKAWFYIGLASFKDFKEFMDATVQLMKDNHVDTTIDILPFDDSINTDEVSFRYADPDRSQEDISSSSWKIQVQDGQTTQDDYVLRLSQDTDTLLFYGCELFEFYSVQEWQEYFHFSFEVAMENDGE